MNSGNLSKKYDSALIINVKDSKLLCGLLTFSHAGAGVVIWLLPWPLWVQAALTAGLAMSLYRTLRYHALHQDRASVTGLEIDTDGDYSVRDPEGDWITCNYVESFRSQWLVIVRLTTGERRRPVTVVLARDAVGPDAFRELRARLQFQSAAETAS